MIIRNRWLELFGKALLVVLLAVFLLLSFNYLLHGASSFLSQENLPLVVFSLGFLAQIALIGGKKLFTWLSAFLFFLSLFFLLPFKHESLSDYNLAFHFLFSVLFFGFCESILLRDRILVRIGEFKLLLFSMLFSYVLFVFFGAGVFFLVSLIPFAVVLFFCLTKFVPGSRARLLLYVWFLLVWAVLFLLLLREFFFGVVFARFLPFLGFQAVEFQAGEYFFFGMSFFFLWSTAICLFMLLPLPRKHESFKHALKRSREMARALVAKFDDRNANWLAALLALFFVGGFFAVNLALKLFAPAVLIAFFLSANGLMDYLRGLKWPGSISRVKQ